MTWGINTLDWSDDRYMAFDLETSGTLPEYALQPWRLRSGDAWITSLVWSYYTNDGILIQRGGLDPRIEDLKAMLDWAISTKRRIVGWNVVFDISWLIAAGLSDLSRQAKWLDAMLLWKHLSVEPDYEKRNVQSFGLKNFVKQTWPTEAGYEEDVDFHDTSPEARAKLHLYNQKDVEFTLRAAKRLAPSLDVRQWRLALIETECFCNVSAANVQGMLIDTIASNELRTELNAKANDCAAKLGLLGVTEAMVRSPAQLATVLFEDWKLPVYKHNTSKLTGKTTRSTDKEVLHELGFKDSRVECIQDYRGALNQKTKFADAVLKSVHYNADDCSHPTAFIFSTYTGRITYASNQGKGVNKRQTGFALHQMKRDKAFRRQVIPPPGYVLMEFDASGQEFRWMAVASGDETMLSLCQSGEDPHSYLGAKIADCDYKDLMQRVAREEKLAEDQRRLGKVGNLSLQYRTSARKLRVIARVDYNIPMTEVEASKIHRIYRNTYPDVINFWNNSIRKTQETQYATTMAGRKVHVAGDWTGSQAWAMTSTAINFRIQGTGADQKYLALAVLADPMRDHGVIFGWDLHDGLYFYVPKAKVEMVAREFKKALDHLPYERVWGFAPTVPMPWDVKAGSSWGDLKKLEV